MDRRTPEHGYTLSSHYKPDSSGELKNHYPKLDLPKCILGHTKICCNCLKNQSGSKVDSLHKLKTEWQTVNLCSSEYRNDPNFSDR